MNGIFILLGWVTLPWIILWGEWLFFRLSPKRTVRESLIYKAKDTIKDLSLIDMIAGVIVVMIVGIWWIPARWFR